jgi:hypothetical protein
MVKNIKRNAFATGMQDKRDMRPLESPENISEPNTEQEPTQAVPETREPSDQSVQTSADMHVQTLTEEEADRRARLITDITHPETPAPSETHQPPKEKRIGSNVTVENWRAWKLKSIEYGTKQAVLLNAAMDYCFQQGHFDQTLIDKYEQKE